ncbi:MAG: cob(I)yrinic acid a,c-diamide adenosyltransferase [Armatimonadota bacterium]
MMLYTGHGDTGYTNVIGGPALLKCHVRLEALGALDEAQAHLGLARALLSTTPWATALARVQAELRLLMGDCATMQHDHVVAQYLTLNHLALLEADLAAWEQLTGGFRGFTTPGETLPGAHLHLARTVIRRAERQIVALSQQDEADPLILTYLNRLSSWVYALALLVESSPDVPTVDAAA